MHVFHRTAGKKWIQGAVHHPGRMKNAAKRAHMPLHEYERKEAHSKNKSLAAAARLGMRFAKGI